MTHGPNLTISFNQPRALRQIIQYTFYSIVSFSITLCSCYAFFSLLFQHTVVSFSVCLYHCFAIRCDFTVFSSFVVVIFLACHLCYSIVVFLLLFWRCECVWVYQNCWNEDDIGNITLPILDFALAQQHRTQTFWSFGLCFPLRFGCFEFYCIYLHAMVLSPAALLLLLLFMLMLMLMRTELHSISICFLFLSFFFFAANYFCACERRNYLLCWCYSSDNILLFDFLISFFFYLPASNQLICYYNTQARIVFLFFCVLLFVFAKYSHLT